MEVTGVVGWGVQGQALITPTTADKVRVNRETQGPKYSKEQKYVSNWKNLFLIVNDVMFQDKANFSRIFILMFHTLIPMERFLFQKWLSQILIIIQIYSFISMMHEGESKLH